MAVLSTFFSTHLFTAGAALYGFLNVNSLLTIYVVQNLRKLGTLRRYETIIKPVVDAMHGILFSPISFIRCCVFILGVQNFWPMWIIVAGPLLYHFSWPFLMTILSTWRICLQVYLGVLVFFRKLREGRSHEFSFDQIFTTVGVPEEWERTIDDLGRMNTMSLLLDIKAFLKGDKESVVEQRNYFGQIAFEYGRVMSGMGAMTLAGVTMKVAALPVGGTAVLAVLSFVGIWTTLGQLAESPYWSSRNVTFLREMHDDFALNEPITSQIANTIFTSVYALLSSLLQCLVNTFSFQFFSQTGPWASAPGNQTALNQTTLNQTALNEEVMAVANEAFGSLRDLSDVTEAGSLYEILTIVARFMVALFLL